MSERPSTLDRVVLSFPSLVSLDKTASTDSPPCSWIQLIRTGSFVSTRYGKFEITVDDLRMMAANFRPDVTPIDYDHIGQDPKRPLDGIAAGWLKNIRLRDNGSQLWGLVEWTPEAAKRIDAREYRFISPSFMKDYTEPTGDKVGTKLLAAALTNLPFLPQMAAVTLGTDAVFGQFALSVQSESTAPRHLASIGQRVSFRMDADHTPELTEIERAQTLVVKSTVGEGDDQFVRLTTLDGTEFGWFRVEQLEPANAPQKQENSPLPSRPENQTEDRMQTTTELEKKATTFAERVQALSKDRSPRAAIELAATQDPDGAESYRLAGIGAEVNTASAPAPMLSLSVRPDESFDALVTRYAIEKNISLREAIREVGKARPDLAASR